MAIIGVSWVPSEENPADGPSRMRDHNEWSIAPNLFEMAAQRWGRPTFDRFASAANTCLPRFNSLGLQEGSAGVDALAQPDWGLFHNWVNPPWGLLSRVARHLGSSGAEATVVMPAWRSCPWFLAILELATDWVVVPRGTKAFAPAVRSFKLPPSLRWDLVLAYVPAR